VRARLQETLSALLGKTAVPHVRVNPEILGGVVVKAGDRIYDGSLRRRLDRLRRQLMSVGLRPSA
jgi:F-type H+-transporting ATPase subunit delta